MDNKIQNIITMIGCKKDEFLNIINKFNGNITMSSGSYYADFWIFCDGLLIAKYDRKGNLIYSI